MKKTSLFANRKQGFLLLIMLISIIGLAGCSKKTDPKPTETQSQLITKASWDHEIIQVQMDDGTWVTKPNDDYYQSFVGFTAITFTQSEQFTATVYYNQTVTGTWTLSSHAVNLNANGNQVSFTVDKLDDSTLIIEWAQSASLQDSGDATQFHIKAVKQTFTH